MKRFVLPLEMWRWDGWVLEGSPAEFSAFCKKHFEDEDDDHTGHAGCCRATDPSEPWVLWVRDRTNAAVLAHEALHIVCAVMRERGVDLAEESEECFAYLLCYIMEAVHASPAKHWERV